MRQIIYDKVKYIADKYKGYIDTEEFAVHVGLPCIIMLVIFIFVTSNTYCKKRKKQ